MFFHTHVSIEKSHTKVLGWAGIETRTLPLRFFEGRRTHGLPIDCLATAARNSVSAVEFNPHAPTTPDMFSIPNFLLSPGQIRDFRKKKKGGAKKSKKELRSPVGFIQEWWGGATHAQKE